MTSEEEAVPELVPAEQQQQLTGPPGTVGCVAWVRRRDDKSGSRVLAVMGHSGTRSCPPLLDIFAFDAKTSSLSYDPLVRFAIHDEGGDPTGIAVHPAGDEFICATAKGCKLFQLVYEEAGVRLLSRDNPALLSVGPQKCLAFSTDGAKFAIGGEDGHLRIFHWPSMNVLLDEPNAHKSFRDMDISLDSEFLASTSIDGSARIWKINEGTPLVNLTRASNERIECCRFSRDGMKPFLFCTVVKNGKVVTGVWDISTWQKIGYKKLLGKPVSVLSISLDGKYLALGSYDGDFCVADVKKMEVSHWSKKIHLGAPVSSIEFCPTERVVISASHQWGARVSKLNVPADWKEWQVWLLLLGLFLVSAVLFFSFSGQMKSFFHPGGGDHHVKPWEVLQNQHQVADDHDQL